MKSTYKLTEQQAADCAEIGRVWGEQEVELWLDQHRDYDADGKEFQSKSMPTWTRGAYCGVLPILPGTDPHGELAEALEDALDDAAQAVWDTARAKQA